MSIQYSNAAPVPPATEKVSRTTTLDARRTRMARDNIAFGLDWPAVRTFGKLGGAFACGAVFAYALIGHEVANSHAPMPIAASHATAVPGHVGNATDPVQQPGPASGAAVATSSAEAPADAVVEVYSDGGGHCSVNAPCGN